MTDPTPKQLAMARRILASCEGDPTWKKASLAGDRDHTKSIKLILAAIIETSERAADLAEGQDAYVASLIRKGDHLDD